MDVHIKQRMPLYIHMLRQRLQLNEPRMQRKRPRKFPPSPGGYDVLRELINPRKKFIFDTVISLFRHVRLAGDVLKRARTRSNEPSRQSAIDQPHFTEISPWKRRRVNRVRARDRAHNSTPRENTGAPGLKTAPGSEKSLSSPAFFFVPFFSSTFHLAGYIY